MRSKAASMSRATSGSSPSLIVTPAVVWGMKIWQTPAVIPDAPTQRFTSGVMFTHSVRREVFTCNFSMRGLADILLAEFMNYAELPGRPWRFDFVPLAYALGEITTLKITQPGVAVLREGRNRGYAVEGEPRLRCGQPAVDVVDVFHALVVQPVFQGLYALLAVDGHGILPGSAAAEDARKIHTRFGSEVQSFRERIVAHAGGKIDEGFLRGGRSLAEKVLGFVARVRGVTFARARTLDEGHGHGNFDLQHIDRILRLAEFLHAASDHFRFLLREFQALFVGALFISHEFEKKRNVGGHAFGADALDPGVLHVII